ncbi:F-box protein At5g07610-like [Coffea eugenioides]|uniref:F-box protein At5g07610-like n=1 Tax=Coffea eugenioides TaxID=49369 RepID=UPI000F60B164|nr:F-box protein At5g07610-like [Coffea eugenioides]
MKSSGLKDPTKISGGFSATAKSTAKTSKFESGKPNQTLKNKASDDDETSSFSSYSSASASAAANVIGNNGDLLIQILLYLPRKSLHRFRSVSKQWLSTICSPDFRRLRSVVASGTLVFFLLVGDRLNFISIHQQKYARSKGDTVPDLCENLNLNPEPEGLHYCNGLLALVFKTEHEYGFGPHYFVVYNPTTCGYRLIPRLKSLYLDRGSRCFQALNIVFDPLKSDHYKLVCVWMEANYPHMCRYRFSVYSSETRIWRDTEDISSSGTWSWTSFNNGVLWNGDLYWIGDSSRILCFDLDKQCLNFTRSPIPRIPGMLWEFGESGGSLYLMEVVVSQAPLLDILELARDCSQWVFKYRVDLALLQSLCPSSKDEVLNRFYPPFCISRLLWDGTEEKPMLVLSPEEGEVILYDIEDMTLLKLEEEEPKDTDRGWRGSSYDRRKVYQFMETRACV